MLNFVAQLFGQPVEGFPFTGIQLQQGRFVNVVEQHPVAGHLPVVLVDAEKIGVKLNGVAAQLVFGLNHEGLVRGKTQQGVRSEGMHGKIGFHPALSLLHHNQAVVIEPLHVVEGGIGVKPEYLEGQIAIGGVDERVGG